MNKIGNLLPIALLLSACGTHSGDDSAASSGKQDEVKHESVKPEKTEFSGEEVKKEDDSHLLQLTALNFLKGGLEPCKDVKDKVFSFSKKDQDLKTLICENSKVEVYAVSSAGVVTFHAVDKETGEELSPTASSVSTFKLGENSSMLRYYPENPYGFTYVMATEVTGIDTGLLEKWNELNNRYTSLRAKVLTAEKSGEKAPSEVLEEIKTIEAEMAKLAKEIDKSRKK